MIRLDPEIEFELSCKKIQSSSKGTKSSESRALRSIGSEDFMSRDLINVSVVMPVKFQVISCDKNICTLQITDTTGSHQFPAMQRLNISKGHAFILVYSVCSRQSFEELQPIWDVIRELKGQDISQIPIMLVRTRATSRLSFSLSFCFCFVSVVRVDF